jgi:sugar phosphate isomerase/epimerase
MIKTLAISGTEYPYKPLDELFNIAVKLDIKNLELWIPHNFKYEDVGHVAETLENKGLNAVVISTWTQLNLPGEAGPRQSLINQSVLAAKALGARFVNTYFGGNSQRTVREALYHYRESILPCLDIATKEGIVITLENEFEISGTDCTRHAELVLELMEIINSPYFRTNYDPCNYYFAGEEPFPYAYEMLKEYISYVHLKDGMKYNPTIHPTPDENFLWKDHSGDYICCKMGEGAINYEGLFDAFSKDEYHGYFGLEPHVPPGQLSAIFSQSLSFITSHLARSRKEFIYESSSS